MVERRGRVVADLMNSTKSLLSCRSWDAATQEHYHTLSSRDMQIKKSNEVVNRVMQLLWHRSSILILASLPVNITATICQCLASNDLTFLASKSTSLFSMAAYRALTYGTVMI